MATTFVKLHYFNLRARGEPVRFLLLHCRLDWDDALVPLDGWKDYKESLPPGRTGRRQLPVLEVSEGETTKMIPESLDIMQWIANKCDKDLLGKTPDDRAKAERFKLYSDEGPVRLGIINPLLNWFTLEEVQPHLSEYLEHLPRHLKVLSDAIGEGPYLCGANLTYTDFEIFHLLDNACTLFGEDNVLNKITVSLRSFYDKMYRLPAISGRLHDRPLAGSGMVGRPGSIIFTTKVPSRLDFVQAAWKEKMESD